MSGVRKKDQSEHHFKAYKASVSYGNSHNLIYRLNRWYEGLWKGGKDNKMAESIIKKRHMDIGQAKDIENSLISQAKQEAIIEYIAICDHPEILDDEEMEVEA